jgi:ribosomal-protein-alanine N-acetyltransferase
LKTLRLLLRPFNLNDVEDVLEYTSDPEWARYQHNIPPHPFSRKDVESLVAMFSDSSTWETGHPGLSSSGSGAGLLQIFAIVFDDKVIGDIALSQRADDSQNERAELAFSLARRHWGIGLMTEAAKAFVDWAFRVYTFKRIFATCDPRNAGSCRVLEKVGMMREGQLRNHVKWNGEVRDQVYYGMLREEWKC